MSALNSHDSYVVTGVFNGKKSFSE